MGLFQKVAALVRKEPAVLTGVVSAGITAGAAFGLHLNLNATKEMYGGAAVITSFLIRAQVSPATSLKQVAAKNSTLEQRVTALEALAKPAAAAVLAVDKSVPRGKV